MASLSRTLPRSCSESDAGECHVRAERQTEVESHDQVERQSQGAAFVFGCVPVLDVDWDRPAGRTRIRDRGDRAAGHRTQGSVHR